MTAIHHARRAADFTAFLINEQLLEIEEERDAIEAAEREARYAEEEREYYATMREIQREEERNWKAGYYYCPVAGHFVKMSDATIEEYVD
jgi:hypothetical protein